MRVRRGDRALFTSELQHLKPTGVDWNTWLWHDVDTPSLERGMDQMELIEPSKGVDIDVLGIVGR